MTNQNLSPPFRIWIAEDEDELRDTLSKALAQGLKEIRPFGNGEELVKALQKDSSFDIIIADLIMPGVGGLQVLEKAKNHNPDGVVIIMTGYASLDTAIQAIRGGAYDYIRKPFRLDELEVVVKNACEKISLVRENRRLLQKLKETMEEMKELRKNLGKRKRAGEGLPEKTLDHKISEMDVLVNQMIPPDYDFKNKEHWENTFQNLVQLTEIKREGLIDETEFRSLKKILLQSLND